LICVSAAVREHFSKEIDYGVREWTSKVFFSNVEVTLSTYTFPHVESNKELEERFMGESITFLAASPDQESPQAQFIQSRMKSQSANDVGSEWPSAI